MEYLSKESNQYRSCPNVNAKDNNSSSVEPASSELNENPHSECDMTLPSKYQLTPHEAAVLKDFELGAKYGNKMAASFAVKGNPYSAMCNDMLATVFSQYFPSSS